MKHLPDSIQCMTKKDKSVELLKELLRLVESGEAELGAVAMDKIGENQVITLEMLPLSTPFSVIWKESAI